MAPGRSGRRPSAGHDLGRDQVARLRRAESIEGARHTKRVRTTKADPASVRHPDLVKRDFTATGPNQLWVTDLTYVPTWAGVAYVCFIIDVPNTWSESNSPSLRQTQCDSLGSGGESLVNVLQVAPWEATWGNRRGGTDAGNLPSRKSS